MFFLAFLNGHYVTVCDRSRGVGSTVQVAFLEAKERIRGDVWSPGEDCWEFRGSHGIFGGLMGCALFDALIILMAVKLFSLYQLPSVLICFG